MSEVTNKLGLLRTFGTGEVVSVNEHTFGDSDVTYVKVLVNVRGKEGIVVIPHTVEVRGRRPEVSEGDYAFFTGTLTVRQREYDGKNRADAVTVGIINTLEADSVPF